MPFRVQFSAAGFPGIPRPGTGRVGGFALREYVRELAVAAFCVLSRGAVCPLGACGAGGTCGAVVAFRVLPLSGLFDGGWLADSAGIAVVPLGVDPLFSADGGRSGHPRRAVVT